MSNGHGGKRDGAGRRKGAAHVKTRKAADRIASDNEVTPLDVMVGAMRAMWAKAEALKDKPESEADCLDYLTQASELASKAAPYIHPRLAAIEYEGKTKVEHNLSKLGDRELARRLTFVLMSAERAPQPGQETFH